jgi:hypothetical protein
LQQLDAEQAQSISALTDVNTEQQQQPGAVGCDAASAAQLAAPPPAGAPDTEIVAAAALASDASSSAAAAAAFCSAGEPCTVCHEEFVAGGQVVALPCRHCFHEACLLPWLGEVSWDNTVTNMLFLSLAVCSWGPGGGAALQALLPRGLPAALAWGGERLLLL